MLFNLELDKKIHKKLEKSRKKEEKKTEYFENTDDIIRKQSQENGQKLNPILQRRLKGKEKACDGMLLYEEEKEGDGIKGHYFDNEAWLGSYSERKDESINFNWNGGSPKNGINRDNFSIKWNGFIYAPYTGKYTFALESDDGASLTLNNELIISHNMHTAAPENSSRTERWLLNEIDKKSNPNKNHYKSSSEKVHLNGGSKYK